MSTIVGHHKTPPSSAFATELLSVNEALAGVAVPSWLAKPRNAGDASDPVAALGLLARHAPKEVVDRVRRWALALPTEDVACLEGWIYAECGLWEDALREQWAGSWLVLRRNHIESLAAIRSLVGVGSPIHVRIRALDERAAETKLRVRVDAGLGDEPSLVAAADADHNAWWADCTRHHVDGATPIVWAKGRIYFDGLGTAWLTCAVSTRNAELVGPGDAARRLTPAELRRHRLTGAATARAAAGDRVELADTGIEYFRPAPQGRPAGSGKNRRPVTVWLSEAEIAALGPGSISVAIRLALRRQAV